MHEDDEKPDGDAPKSVYAIGYGKPPKHTRFKPGQSGNPRGRSKGTKNLKTDLTEELGEKIVVREGDRSQTVSKQRAVVKTMVARTLKGDARAGTLLLSAMMRLLNTGEDEPAGDGPLLEDDLEILRAFEGRVRRDIAPQTDSPANRDDASEGES